VQDRIADSGGQPSDLTDSGAGKPTHTLGRWAN